MDLTKVIVTGAALLLSLYCQSQNTTSPYSILGIGDIETKDFGRWYGMGSANVALSNPYYINAANPASLMGLNERMMSFDLVNRGKSARFKYPGADSLTPTTKDLSIRRISLAFKPNKKWAFSVGLKPFSSINYLLAETNTMYSNSSALAKAVDGSGGLNQVYFSYARKLNKNLSAGLTSSYYFGSANIQTSYYGSDLSISLVKQQYDIMSAFQFQGGLQYLVNTSKQVQHRLGLTVSNATTVKRSTAIAYLSNGTDVKQVNETKKDFKLPLSVTAGYALVLNNDFTISADAMISNWKKQKVSYPGSYTTTAGRLSIGAEYINRKKIGNYWVENWHLQGGANAEKNYISIQGNDILTYALSAGFGKNLSGLISIYSGIELGVKGSTKKGQIKEQFTQYVIGFTLKEFWFNTKKYGRYQ
ncbi:MAG: hypothetical protein RL172_794 [Bacteroidota bacterium]|jgi:hypothetical protein